jgi:hypothetical protein
MQRQVSYPWAQLLREVEAIWGSGVRVISLEQDGAAGRATLVVELRRHQDLDTVLAQLAGTTERSHAWATESVSAQGNNFQARMRRSAW